MEVSFLYAWFPSYVDEYFSNLMFRFLFHFCAAFISVFEEHIDSHSTNKTNKPKLAFVTFEKSKMDVLLLKNLNFRILWKFIALNPWMEQKKRTRKNTKTSLFEFFLFLSWSLIVWNFPDKKTISKPLCRQLWACKCIWGRERLFFSTLNCMNAFFIEYSRHNALA